MRNISKLLLLLTGIVSCCAYVSVGVSANSTYGSGTYGSCSYNSCGISLSSSSTVTLNVTPGVSATCTVQEDEVEVATGSSTGYTLTLSNSDTDNQMAGSNGGTIDPVSGTGSSPATLSANTWGFRVDEIGGFGSGPTGASSNGAIPSQQFAATPLSSSAAETIATSSLPADPAVATSVWYGLCADTTLPSGTFSDSITYTAVVN